MATFNLTPAQFAAALIKLEADLKLPVENPASPFHHTMIKACMRIQSDAQNLMGSYHQSFGPFPKWDRLADSTNANRERKGFAPDEPLLRTGEMQRSIKYKIMGDTGHIGSDSPVAVFQELGTARIPARSFLGRTGFKDAPVVEGMFGRRVVQVMKLHGKLANGAVQDDG